MIRTDDRTVRMSMSEAESLSDLLETEGYTSIAAALDNAASITTKMGTSSAAVMLWIDE